MASRVAETNGLDVHEADDDLDVFDADALLAETDLKPFRWRWAGEVWTFPARMGIKVVDVIEGGETMPALRMLLGDQWARFDELLETVDLDVPTLKAVIDTYVEKQSGVKLPNSGRPTPSYGRGRPR